jgi:hypothetical protein
VGVSYTPDVVSTITLLDDLGTTQYVGKAAPRSSTAAPVWQIQRLQTTGTILAVQFADGNTNFDNVWDARASLSYL